MGRKGTPLENVEFSKTDGFPLAYNMKDDIAVMLSPADLPGYLGHFDGWAACKDGPFIHDFAKIIAPLSADGTQRNWGGAPHKAPSLQTTMTMGMYPDVFDQQNSVAHVDGQLHPLAGFYKLNLLVLKLTLHAQGTALQMKMALMNKIQNKISEKSPSPYDATTFLDEISPLINNIVVKQADMKGSVELETNHSVMTSIRKACRDTTDNPSASAELRNAADDIKIKTHPHVQ